MSNFVNVSTLAMSAADFSTLESSFSCYEREMKAYFKRTVEEVLPSKPDLIVFPEASSRFTPYTQKQLCDFYREAGDGIIDFLSEIAKKNSTNIAYGTHRYVGEPDGLPLRNSIVYIGRDGSVRGIYDKNHLVQKCDFNEGEYQNGIKYGTEAKLVELDFGKCASAICFDLNFDELMYEYARQKPSLVVFSSVYHGGLLRTAQWAYACRSYFVSSVMNLPSSVINPYGDVLASTTNYTKHATARINLDYAICHMDYNMDKVLAAKRKYGEALSVYDPGFFGSVLLSYNGSDKTVNDVIREFEIEYLDDYLNNTREHRRTHI